LTTGNGPGYNKNNFLIGRQGDIFYAGDIVRHFKRELLSPEELEREPDMYLYEIIGEAEHTETGGKLMVYRPLYGDGKLYARPAEMFSSPVDREKYPHVKQKMRFEKEE